MKTVILSLAATAASLFACSSARAVPIDLTADLQGRIDAAWRAGGGTVRVPSGDWSVRSIRLRSGVTLHLDADAHLWASRSPRDYDGVLENDRVEPFAGYPVELGKEDLSRKWENGIVKIFRAKDVAIVGERGSFIDGRNCADATGEEGYRGPHGVWAACATNVTLRGVTLRNTGNWATRFIHCANLAFERVTILGGHDGVHVRASDGVRIADCDLDTGDDCVAGYANRGVLVTNCTLRSACSPFRFGGRDVLVVDCRARGPAHHPHRWTLTAEEKARGAGADEVTGRRTTGCAFQPFTDLRLRTWLKPGNIVFRDVTFENANRFIVFLNGLGALWQDGTAIEDITFERCAIRGMTGASYVYAPEKTPLKLVFRDCLVACGSDRPAALYHKNVDLVVENVRTEGVATFAERKDDLSFADIPDFPSWRIESDAQRAVWGLPPLPTRPARIPLDGTWDFSREGGPWTAVEVPHDWSIRGPFLPSANGHTGKLPWRGKGRYRRTFPVDRALMATLAAGGRAYLEFDGVMARPEVKLNGRAAGGWDYGYMGFVLDVTDKVKEGGNLVEVSVDTTTTSPRWYVGGGIIRPVSFRVATRESPRPHSVFITTPEVSRERARVDWRYVTVGGEEKSGSFVLARPRLWDVDDPYLHSVVLGGEEFRYGVRKAEWTVDDGFRLNGRRVQLKGVCLHSDLGPLGAVFNRAAVKRQLLAMKDMGANAVRTAHNAQATGSLDLCDELGLLVYNECFDKWDGTIGRRADEPLEPYVERNLRNWVARDRNHPSVICWSLANELMATTHADGRVWKADGVSAERVARFREVVRALDPTRPVTVSHNFGVEWGCVDAADLNDGHYGASYRKSKTRNPDKPTVYSESASAVSSYGFYQFPAPRARGDYAVVERECDGYDRTASASLAEDEFNHLARDRYCAGEFIWTGIDYLGEPTPYLMWQANPAAPWNKQWKRERNAGTDLQQEELSRSAYFGACDLVCIPKDRFYLYRAHWNDKADTCHVLPHWNWGGDRGVTNLPVVVYSNGDAAELFLNGRSLGRRAKANYRFTWPSVAWEAGELKAVAYRGDAKIAEDVVRTCGRPAAVRLTRDPYSNGDLEFVQVDVVDAEGTRDPWARDRISFALDGPGEIVAVGNGSAHGYDAFGDTASHPLFYGKALAIVRRAGPGRIVLTASCGTLRPATLALE